MSKVKDLQLRIYDIAMDTLVPLFAKEFDADCIEFCVGEESLEIELMVEHAGGDDYFRMDLNSLFEDSIGWSDEDYVKFFEKSFTVFSKYPFKKSKSGLSRYPDLMSNNFSYQY